MEQKKKSNQKNDVAQKAQNEAADAVAEPTGKENSAKKAQNARGADTKQTAGDAQKAIEQHKKAHKNRIIAVSIIAVAIVVALISAFVWPGWAHRNATNSANTATGKEEVAKVEPVALPKNATKLERTLADNVGIYARGTVKKSTVWNATTPIEEYQVVYTNGNTEQDITVTVGQWTSSTYANEQYEDLTARLKGKLLNDGKISVSGENTGAYEIHEDSSNSEQSVAVWQNSTVVYQAVGPKNALNNFFAQFKY